MIGQRNYIGNLHCLGVIDGLDLIRNRLAGNLQHLAFNMIPISRCFSTKVYIGVKIDMVRYSWMDEFDTRAVQLLGEI